MIDHQAQQLKEDICLSLEPCKYTREEIIEKLVKQNIEDEGMSNSNYLIVTLLTEGFKGYKNMTLVKLKREYNEMFVESI